MRIALLSTSETTGGAAIVTRRITEALRSLGHDARMIVLRRDEYENNDFVETVSGTKCRSRLFPFVAERGEIFLQNGLNRTDLWKVSTASAGLAAASHKFIREADAIVIGWICQGFLSLAEIKRILALKKPTLAVMHDQWAMTGICHLPGGCSRWKKNEKCGQCPLLHCMAWKHDLSRRVWNRKSQLYQNADNLKFVAVSTWLASRAAESTLLCDKDITVIPNPIALPPPESISTSSRKPVILMGAARLDEDVKNLPLAIKALNLLHDNRRCGNAEAVFFGGLRNGNALSGLRMPHRWLGPIKSEEVNRLMRESKVILSTSHFEMLPTTIVEGLANGCVAVATDSGGQRDIIENNLNGRLVDPGDAQGLSDALEWALSDSAPDARQLRLSAGKFEAESVARRYLQLLNSFNSKTI